MKGVKFSRFKNGVGMLVVSDVGEVPKWRARLKELRKVRPKKRTVEQQDEIDALDFYIFMSGETYSIKERTCN